MEETIRINISATAAKNTLREAKDLETPI